MFFDGPNLFSRFFVEGHLMTISAKLFWILMSVFMGEDAWDKPPGGGGGTLFFFFIRRLGPSIYLHPQKYQEFQAPQKIFGIFANPKNTLHYVPWPQEKTLKCIEMTPKYIFFCNDPKKVFTKSTFFFLKTPKILYFKILNPPKMTWAYVCVKISEYPAPTGINHVPWSGGMLFYGLYSF